jgi:peptidoglycan/xylan/chitin deacetylase (PgdA/CDA1 family)
MSGKRLIRSCVAAGCAASGLLGLAEARNRRRLTILTYHRVLPADQKAAYFAPDLVTTLDSFRRHCQVLREYFDVHTLSDAVNLLCREHGSKRPLAAITFDDGYRDNYEYAAPILAEMGIRATFFVISDLVGATEPPWFDRLAWACEEWCRQAKQYSKSLSPMIAKLFGSTPARSQHSRLVRAVVAHAKRLSPDDRKRLGEWIEASAVLRADLVSFSLIMDWQQLKTLARAGHEIGSHSCTHAILTRLDDLSLRREVRSSRIQLESHLGYPVGAFCYPNGDFDDRVVQATASAGYACAVTVIAGSNQHGDDPYRLRRRFVHEDRLIGLHGTASSVLLRTELCGLADHIFARRHRPL